MTVANIDQLIGELRSLVYDRKHAFPNLELFEITDQMVFPLYGASGGLVTDYIIYFMLSGHGPMESFDMGAKEGVIANLGNGYKCIPVILRYDFSVDEAITHATELLDKFLMEAT